MNATIRACLSSALLLVLGAGCVNNTPQADHGTSRVGITLSSSRREVLVGENVTISALSTDTYGRDSKIEWTATFGKLTTEENGRVARVSFAQPGVSTVTATLMIDGHEADRKNVEIRVNPVK